ARRAESAAATSSPTVSAAALSARALSGRRLSGRAAESGDAAVPASVVCPAGCAWRRLSWCALSAVSWASASRDWASASAPAQPATPRVPSNASVSRALRATGLSLRGGSLDVGADLELGLQERAGGVAQRLAGRGTRLIELDVVGHDDPLQARHVGEELAD